MSGSTVTIVFEGRPMACRSGQSVAAALWEHGIRILSHSPKYGRPRGVWCARGHCTHCLMRIDGVPNVRACRTTVRDGMRVERQDSGAFYGPPLQKTLERAGDLLPVGFYYKWFTRPPAVARLFLTGLRPLAGIGRLPDAAHWAAETKVSPPRDLGRVRTVVVGAGASGLAAAARAAGDGRVLLIDEVDRPGGQRRLALDAVAAADSSLVAALPPLAALRDRLDRHAAVTRLDEVDFRGETRVVGAWQPNQLLLRDRDGLLQVRADRIVWAAGCFDRLPLFDDADRPGIVGPRGLYRLLGRDGLTVSGMRAVVWGEGSDLWLCATLLCAGGAQVTLVPAGETDADLLAAAQRHGWALHTGCRPVRTHTERGALAIMVFDGGGAEVKIPCGLAVPATRGVPTYDGPYQLGVDLILDPARGGYVPREPQQHPLVEVVGEAAGVPAGLEVG